MKHQVQNGKLVIGLVKHGNMKKLINKILKEEITIQSTDSVFAIVNNVDNELLMYDDDDGGYSFTTRYGNVYPITVKQIMSNSFPTKEMAESVLSVFIQQREEAAEWDESEDYNTDNWEVVEYMIALEPRKDMDNLFNT
mgnify:FL=1